MQVTLDMVEMVFAKADPRVSLLYEEHLCEPELHTFGDSVRRCGFLPASPIETLLSVWRPTSVLLVSTLLSLLSRLHRVQERVHTNLVRSLYEALCRSVLQGV